MNQIEINNANGSKSVIATQNDNGSKWNARLYVNGGETATLVCAKFATEVEVRTWAKAILL